MSFKTVISNDKTEVNLNKDVLQDDNFFNTILKSCSGGDNMLEINVPMLSLQSYVAFLQMKIIEKHNTKDDMLSLLNNSTMYLDINYDNYLRKRFFSLSKEDQEEVIRTIDITLVDILLEGATFKDVSCVKSSYITLLWIKMKYGLTKEQLIFPFINGSHVKDRKTYLKEHYIPKANKLYEIFQLMVLNREYSLLYELFNTDMFHTDNNYDEMEDISIIFANINENSSLILKINRLECLTKITYSNDDEDELSNLSLSYDEGTLRGCSFEDIEEGIDFDLSIDDLFTNDRMIRRVFKYYIL